MSPTSQVVNKKARVIAYYLPQYHPTALNDEWWGKGFTEWTNVGKAEPLFKGHYQPRVPADLGYYDLRLPEIREAQAEMARNAGVEGFMYWDYWFGNGVKQLEMPLRELLRTGKPDFPFCIGWGNHSWNNHDWNPDTQWKRNRNMIEQKYLGVDDYKKYFYSLLDAFQDGRYIKVEGKPFFLIYSPSSLPNQKEFIDTWQELAIKNGLPGIYFVGQDQPFTKKIFEGGFDAKNTNGQWRAESKIKGRYFRTVQNKINKYIGGLSLDVYKYKDIINGFFTEEDAEKNIIPSILPQWDRSPRSGRRAVIYKGSTPELFKIHVEEALKIIGKKPEQHRILMLKSWNEWAEGNYVEPDVVFGTGYLDVLRDCILK